MCKILASTVEATIILLIIDKPRLFCIKLVVRRQECEMLPVQNNISADRVSWRHIVVTLVRISINNKYKQTCYNSVKIDP